MLFCVCRVWEERCHVVSMRGKMLCCMCKVCSCFRALCSALCYLFFLFASLDVYQPSLVSLALKTLLASVPAGVRILFILGTICSFLFYVKLKGNSGAIPLSFYPTNPMNKDYCYLAHGTRGLHMGPFCITTAVELLPVALHTHQ